MKPWLSAIPLLAAVATAVPVHGQDPQPAPQEKTLQERLDELAREVAVLKRQVGELQVEKEKLVRENDFLRREVEGLRVASAEAAKEALMLKQALQAGGAIPPAKAEGRADPGDAGGAKNPLDVADGPKEVLRAKVWAVDPAYGFVIINKGKADGVRPGFRFDIMRRTRVRSDDPAKPDDWRWEKLGTGEFEKYIGMSEAQSKLKIVEGKAQDMKYEDEAVAHRRLEASTSDGAKPAPAPAPGAKKFKITGKAGDAYMLNYGSQSGARQSDRVYVYRDNRLRAELRIDTVDKDWSVARLIDRTQNGEFGEGDEVTAQKQKITIVGRVKLNTEKQGIILEAGLKNGVKPGMQFEVRRQGRKIGVVVAKKVLDFVCEAEPTGDLKREDVFAEDFVESIE